MEESLKLYHIKYTVQKHARSEAFGHREYLPHSDSVFRAARNSDEATQSFNRHIAPQLMTHTKRETDLDGTVLYDGISVIIYSARKVDSVQGHRISVDQD